MKSSSSLFKSSVSGISYVVPFFMVTTCFAMWGFANDITNPMVKAFSKIFRMSVTDGTLVQAAFYGGYFAMALPAALFIKKYSFKAGILMGLSLYAFGAFMFIPATWTGSYYPFLIAYFILTCGLSFLETSANPYILSMGDKLTATRRLNLAQAFNPIGSLAGMFVAMQFIQSRLSPLSSSERALLDDNAFEALKQSDLHILSTPYVYIGVVILLMIVLMVTFKLPKGESEETEGRSVAFQPTVKRLFGIRSYREGVLAQFFYVGVQIMCWTFIIQYGTRVFMAEGMDEKSAEILSQQFNIAAMLLFCASRFICTFLMKFWNPGKILTLLAAIGAVLIVGVITVDGRAGMYMLVLVSGCMSLMFPTIYALALNPVSNEDAKIGAAGLIMAILGGSLLPLLQASIIDGAGFLGLPPVNLSFAVPFVCFIIIMLYGLRTQRLK